MSIYCPGNPNHYSKTAQLWLCRELNVEDCCRICGLCELPFFTCHFFVKPNHSVTFLHSVSTGMYWTKRVTESPEK